MTEQTRQQKSSPALFVTTATPRTPGTLAIRLSSALPQVPRLPTRPVPTAIILTLFLMSHLARLRRRTRSYCSLCIYNKIWKYPLSLLYMHRHIRADVPPTPRSELSSQYPIPQLRVPAPAGHAPAGPPPSLPDSSLQRIHAIKTQHFNVHLFINLSCMRFSSL